MNEVLVVVVILTTIIAYLVIRFILFWHASRIGKKCKDR